MATTTPNYGWTVPTSTDLVKDGATAIETLGDAIDASMNTALGTKKAGMVLLNTTSFSGVASQAFPNSTFSTTYTHYFITYSLTGSVSGAELQMVLLASGTPSTTSYYMSGTTLTVGGTSAQLLRNNGANIRLNGDISANWNVGGYIFFQRPFIASATSYEFAGNWVTDSANGSAQGAGVHTAATSYDSVRIQPSSGNITGTISCYGYNV